MKSNTFVQILTILTLVLFTRLTFAQVKQFNDWMVGGSTSGPCAITGNNSGKFALYRLADTTYWWVIEQTGLNCTDKSKISVLIGTNGNFWDTEVVCSRDGIGNPQFVFSDTALVTQALQRATKVQIHVPIKNGRYIFEFSLLGMSDAVSYLESIPQSIPPPATRATRCPQLWDAYYECQEDFKKCTVRTQGTGPCPSCFIPNCPQ